LKKRSFLKMMLMLTWDILSESFQMQLVYGRKEEKFTKI
jgi:hypothetical protein